LCRTEINSTNVYRDGSHISVLMSENFTNRFVSALRDLSK
jgi:hypothetical protein